MKYSDFYIIDASTISSDVNTILTYQISETNIFSNIEIDIPYYIKKDDQHNHQKHLFHCQKMAQLANTFKAFQLNHHRSAKTIYQDNHVWVAGKFRSMTVSEYDFCHQSWLCIDIEDLNTCWLLLSKNTAFFQHNDMSQQNLLEYFLGPIYNNLISNRHHFSFHASAVLDREDNKAILFIAESGTGKSTIAKKLHNTDDFTGNYIRLSDDIIPTKIMTINQRCVLFSLPHFPQPKLSNNEQYFDHASSIEVKAMIKLNPFDYQQEKGNVSITKLSSTDAFLLSIRHGVATRSFNQNILTKHFNFCKNVTSFTPFYALSYPRRLDIYPQIYQCLKNSLS